MPYNDDKNLENKRNTDYSTSLKELQKSLVQLSKNIASFHNPGFARGSFKKNLMPEESSNPDQCEDSDSNNGYENTN